MNHKVVVCGVGMIPFATPGSSLSYEIMGASAAKAALADAGLGYQQIQQGYVGYVYGGSCSGQAALYHVGLSAVPIVNVNNNGATGSTALFLAVQAVAHGAAECALALGFEQMCRGATTFQFEDRPDPSQRLLSSMRNIQGVELEVPIAAQISGGAARMHMQLYGTRPETLARIAVKARSHAAHNPYALLRAPVTLEEVLSSPTVFEPLTKLQCCPATCGAAAAIVCTEQFARRNGLDRSVVVLAQSMTSDGNSSFDENDMRRLAGYDMARRAAARTYEKAAIGPDQVAVVELHDCFTANELISYEALGLAAEGEAEKFVLDGNNTYGGRVVVNPSGGLLSKGDPLGATGLAQCAELVWQLRGQAHGRQVESARLALQHNLGLGGACVVTLYARAL